GAGRAEPRLALVVPLRQARLRVGIDERHDTSVTCPGDAEMRGEGRLAGAALALRDGDDGGRHDRRSSLRESPLSLMLASMSVRCRCCAASGSAGGGAKGLAPSEAARGASSVRLTGGGPARAWPLARFSPQRSCARLFSKPRASSAASSAVRDM